MDPEQQKKLSQSQGIKLSRPDGIFRTRNRIEEALGERIQRPNNQNDSFLPQINKFGSDEPLRIIKEDIPQIKVNIIEKVQKPKTTPKFFRIIKRFLVPLSFLAIVGLVLYGAYWGIMKYRSANVVNSASLIKELEKLTIVPKNETPTVVTVANLEPLKGQPIFKNAKVGDILLIFTKAKKAILYRPSENRVIVNSTLTD